MDQYDLDRDYYVSILNTKGLSAALSELHHQMEKIEQDCFEGTAGYRPELFEKLVDYRDFSRELWNLNHTQGEAESR